MRTEDLERNFRTKSDTTCKKAGRRGPSASEAKEIIESMDLGIVRVDQNARISYVNPSAAYMLLKSREQARGEVLWSVVPDNLAKVLSETFLDVCAKHAPVHFEIECRAPEERWFRCRLLPVSKGFTLILEDITGRKKMEKELREIEEIHRFHFSYSNDVIYSYDDEFRIMSVSQNVERILGYRPEEIIGRPFPELGVLDSDDLEGASRDALAILSGSTIRTAVYRFIAKDGRVLFGDTSGIPLIREGRVVGVISVARDITDRKKAEAAILESEEKYRLVVENANEGIYVSQDGNLKFVNPKLCEILGYSEEDLIGKPFTLFVHPDDRDLVMGRYVKRMKGESIPDVYPFRTVDKQGSTRWVQINAVRISWKGGPATLNFLTDITERMQAEQDRKKLEEQLVQTQKIEALGSFAGCIAHDLNNFIYPVIINTELLLEDEALDSSTKEILQQTLSAACRQRDLVKQILFFSRRSEPNQVSIRIAHLLEEALGFLRSSIPSTIEIRRRIDAPSDTIMGDPTQIQQVVMNLCKNAADALETRRGTIEITLDDLYLDMLSGHPELKPGKYVRLSVRDDGCGMSREVMDRIFEPFFSTKEKGKGSGMGLPVVHGIVKSHGGGITVQSEEGKGSLFSVYLPVRDVQSLP